MTLYSVRNTSGDTLWFPSKKAAKRHQIDNNRADRKAEKEYKKDQQTDGDFSAFQSTKCDPPIMHKIKSGKASMVDFLNNQMGG